MSASVRNSTSWCIWHELRLLHRTPATVRSGTPHQPTNIYRLESSALVVAKRRNELFFAYSYSRPHKKHDRSGAPIGTEMVMQSAD